MSLPNRRRGLVPPPPPRYDPEWENRLRLAMEHVLVPSDFTNSYPFNSPYLSGGRIEVTQISNVTGGPSNVTGDFTKTSPHDEESEVDGSHHWAMRQWRPPSYCGTAYYASPARLPESVSASPNVSGFRLDYDNLAPWSSYDAIADALASTDTKICFQAPVGYSTQATLMGGAVGRVDDEMLAETKSYWQMSLADLRDGISDYALSLAYYQNVSNNASGSLLTQRTVLDVTSPLEAVDNPGAFCTTIRINATAADKYLYSTGVDTWAEGSLSAFARSLLDDANASVCRNTLGAIGGSSLGVYEIVYGTGINSVDSSPIFTIDLTPSSLSLLGNFGMVNTQAANLGLTSLRILANHSAPIDGVRGIDNSVSVTGTSVITGISRGIINALTINKTGGSFNSAVGSEYILTLDGSIGTGTVYGLVGSIILGGTTTVTDLYGNYTNAISFTGAGPSVTNNYGWYIGDQGHAQVGTAKCISIGAQTNSATKTWVFAVDATQDSYFAGQFGVGMTTAPGEQVEIRDASGVQLRLSTSGTVYSNFQNEATTGVLTITTVGTTPNVNIGTSTAFTFSTSSGNLGIGQASSSTSRVAIAFAPTTSAAWRGVSVALNPDYNTGGTITTSPNGVSSIVTVTGTDTVNANPTGFLAQTIINKSSGAAGGGAGNSVRGGSFALTNSGAAAITVGYGVRTVITVTGAGNVTTGAVYYAGAPTLSSTGVITTNHGLYIDNQGHATLVGTCYGIYIAAQTTSATATWGFASAHTGNHYSLGNWMFGSAVAPTGIVHLRAAASGDVVQTIETTTSGDDPIEYTRQYRVTTTNATVTTLATIALTASKTYMIQAKVIARRTGGSAGTAEDGAGYVVTATFNTVGGVVTLIGAVDQDVVQESQAGWDCTMDSDGAGNARIRVTGATNNNVTWHAHVRTIEVGS